MSYTLIIHSETFAELDEAERYFEDRSPGLGRRFRAAVGNSLAFILERPVGYAERSSGFRYGIVARFPYRVIYKVQDQVIFIAAVYTANAGRMVGWSGALEIHTLIAAEK